MVGVKGKYKGCNTCRKRRVACDNTRPLCKKCTDHGRHCEGYQTETVFIVGTIDDGGRCASHPPRNVQSSTTRPVNKKKASEIDSLSVSPEPAKSRRRAASEGQQNNKLDFSDVKPLRPSWDGTVNIASVGGLHRVRFAAVHTSLKAIRRQRERLGDWEVKLALPTPKRADVAPGFQEEDFKLGAECFLNLPGSSWRTTPEQKWEDEKEEGICLFLYEQNNSALYNNKPPWKDPAILDNPICQQGPGAFKKFPGHHFFTRVYRPNAIFTAILNRTPTPLSDPEWNTVPWEHSPKTALDSLLDIISRLPGLLYRSDRIIALQPSASRRLKAKDVLLNCASTEAHLGVWYAGVEEAASRNRENPLLYWPWQGQSGDIGHWEQGQVPFQVTYEFPGAEGGLAHIYYWAGLIVLYGVMARLVEIATKDVGSSSVATPPKSVQAASQVSGTPTNTHLQPQAQRHVYSSATPSPHSYGSVSTEDLSTSLTTEPLTYYSSRSISPYQVSTSPYILPAVLSSTDLLPNISSAKYGPREIRKLAAHVCRSLDWAIGRSSNDGLGALGQPDLVAAPLYIVERFYDSIVAVDDGELEREWCSGFRERWEQRGREIERTIFGVENDPVPGASTAGKIPSRSWIELGKFGV